MTRDSQPLQPAIIKAVLGPTNTGKTHYAIERMLGHASGVIGLPLRLLAREVYDKIVARKGEKLCALITGEEKIIPPTAQYYVCTVEAMPTEKNFNFLAVDEVQLMAHHERGHIFTDRVLHARGIFETLFMGAETIKDVLSTLVPKIKFDHRERFSELHYGGATKLTRLPKRSVIVAFSAQEVYALAELLRRFRGGAAVVMGGLSPRTRNAQADLFQNGDVDFLVATDAIGMGLNLDTDHVAFAGLSKYDGRRRRMLTPMEAAQIAGRAGRFRNDGTFGTTADCPAFDDEMIKRIEAHSFEDIQYVEWRNSDLNFDSLESLMESLHAPRLTKRLRRIKGAEDEAALERLIAIPEINAAMKTRAQVKQLWDICQIPDFRNLTIDTHVKLLQDIYRMLVTHGGKLPDSFMEQRIARCDETDGDVERLSSRLAHIRTWTYCASKTSWMPKTAGNIKHWANIAREVEDRLSDALHERLTARFVDRRTSKLLKGIGSKAFMDAKIKDNGDVYVDDVLIGKLEGLRFQKDESASEMEAKALEAAAQKAVAPEIDRRLTSLCGGTHAIFTLADNGQIMWGNMAVGKISPSGSIFSPDAALLGGELGNENLRNLAEDRMREFLRAEVKTHLEPLKRLKDFPDQAGASAEAKGFAFLLLENHGSLDRFPHGKTIKALTQEPRRELRALGVVFGHYNIYMTDLIKPKPARLLSLLMSYGAGGDKKPFIPFAGVTSIPNEGELSSKNFAPQALALAGYRAVGPRIVRFDILNRLSDLIRDAGIQFEQEKNPGVTDKKFQIMQEMLALLGSGFEDVRGVLTGLGYGAETEDAPLTTPLPITTDETAPTETAPAEPVSNPAPNTETAAADAAPAETPAAEEDAKAETSNHDADVKPIDTPTADETAAEETKKAPPPKVGTPPNTKGMSKRLTKKIASRKRLSLYNHRIPQEDGTTLEQPNLEYWSYVGFARTQPRKNRKPRRYSNKPKQGHGNKPVNTYSSGKAAAPRKNKFENSPFAALAALKNDADKKS